KKRQGREISTRERYKRKYKEASGNAQKALKVDPNGLYSLALKLSRAAEKERSAYLIQFFNELAKLLRSLIVPFVILGLYFFYRRCWGTGTIVLLSAVAAGFLYPELKVLHIRRLYNSAAA